MVRLAIACLATLPALWIVTAPTAANIMASGNPALALKIWPWNADAQAQQATAIVRPGVSPRQLERAQMLAWNALAREPVNISAVRSLALADDLRGRSGAGRLFTYAEELSRRDLVTELWMIESFVARGDIQAALIHYDRALRTRKEAEPLLLPILVSALASPGTRDPIGRLIATRPQWWPRYMEQALADPAAMDSLPFVFSHLRVSSDNEQGRGFLSTGIAGLIRAGRYAAALSVYRGAAGRTVEREIVPHDGSFERDPLLPPFDWQLATSEDVSALIQARTGGGRVLFAVPAEGASGEVARQFLVLPAGDYRLAYRGGSLPENGLRLTLKLQCVIDGEQHDIVTRQVAPAPEAGRIGALPFTVPANGCTGQWLIVSVDNPGSMPEALPWIDDLRIQRVPT